MKTARPATAALALIGLVSFCNRAVPAEEAKLFQLSPDDHGMLLQTPSGQTMFRYMTEKPEGSKLTANSVCCLYPVFTPAGKEAVEFAPGDHPHHRGIFLAWHAVDGTKPADFWGWGAWAPTADRQIINRDLRVGRADTQQAVIEVRNEWVAEGEVLIEENTSITARLHEGTHLIELDFRLLPKQDLSLRQSAFGGLCVKSWKDGQGVYTSPAGPVALPPPHHLKPESDWPGAAWYDYTVTREDGPTVGIAVIDHPGNPPTLWHNLEPIAMLNPCIVAPGPVQLREGQPLRLRYLLVVHDGPPPLDLLARVSQRWRQK